MAKFVKGKYAFGYCDRSGFRYPIGKLVPETYQGKPTGVRVGVDMFDKEQPQDWQGIVPHDADAEAIRDARPDTSMQESRQMFSWDPVGYGNTLMTFGLGMVRVV